MPRQTSSGYTRFLTEREFLRSHVINVVLCAIIIDFIYLQMSVDPYYLAGPNHEYELPPLIAHKSPLRLLFCRQSYAVVFVVSCITYMYSTTAIFQYYIFKIFFPSRAFLWKFPSTFGKFSEVLDRGLAGWWGSWWHQTFRVVFLAPSVYLMKKGYLKRGSLAANVFGLFISFFQSGLLHAAGSYTTIPDTKPMKHVYFFVLQAVGIVLQQHLALALRYVAPELPRAIRRAGNLAFAVSWLFVTAPMFVDDMAVGGLWLHQVMPISPFRLMGLGHVLSFGHADNTWWRWDKECWFKMYEAKHWWEVGIAF